MVNAVKMAIEPLIKMQTKPKVQDVFLVIKIKFGLIVVKVI